MKLNLKCIKNIMIYLEQNLNNGEIYSDMLIEHFDKYSDKDIYNALKFLSDSEYIECYIAESDDKSVWKAVVSEIMTPNGIKYLNLIKIPRILQVIKLHFKSTIGILSGIAGIIGTIILIIGFLA